MLLYVDANFASPYALVAFVSLIEKGLEFEIEALDLATHANHDPNFARTSITRRIPTLIHDGFALSESSAICEYIDRHAPLPRRPAGSGQSPPNSSLGSQRSHADSR
jgi:glutathione S-transferase